MDKKLGLKREREIEDWWNENTSKTVWHWRQKKVCLDSKSQSFKQITDKKNTKKE